MSVFSVKVVTPVQETVSQAVPADGKTKSDPERFHVWEVRHAGLLGIDYEVAMQNNLFDQPGIKQTR